MQDKLINYLDRTAVMCEKVKVLLSEIADVLAMDGTDSKLSASQIFTLITLANIAIDYIHDTEIDAERLSDEYYRSRGEA